MSESTPPPPETAGPSWVIPRDHQTVMTLPVAFRWEVTRRHPRASASPIA